MQHRNALVASLKVCTRQKALQKGIQVHRELWRMGLLKKDTSAMTILINMYAKCGALCLAEEVFDNLPVPSVVAWNAIIAGYAQNGHSTEALIWFQNMQVHGTPPDPVTYVCALKACGNLRASGKGKELHAEIMCERLVEKDVFIGTALVDMYAKCGMLENAREMFHKLPIDDVIACNALITGYVKHGYSKQALIFFDRMQSKGISPNVVTYVGVLQACGSTGAVEEGQRIHAELNRKGMLTKHAYIGTALVDMYTRCGLVTKAQEVFGKLATRDVACWNALITGYAQHGLGEDALKCFESMQLEGHSPNEVTLTSILKACGSIGAADKGQEIYDMLASKGLVEMNSVFGNALVDMYCKCGMLANAQDAFDDLPNRDVVTWTALITGYAQHGHGDEAIKCYERMMDEGFSPNEVTFICVLKACASIGAIDKGEKIRNQIVQQGLLQDHVLVGNALVDMYIKCGFLTKARGEFDKLPFRDVGSWNVMITGYVQERHLEEAINCFEQMQLSDIAPNAITFLCILKAYSGLGDITRAQNLHAEIAREGLIEKHTMIGNSLVDLYAKCGQFFKAHELFDMILVRDAVPWSTLIAGYADNGCAEESLICYEQMRQEGLVPNAVTFICLLKACGTLGVAEKGQDIHNGILKEDLLDKHITVGNALVDMYGKCGLLLKAQDVFDKLPTRDIVSWSALIAGYALLGSSDVVFSLFKKMLIEGVVPDSITITSVLNACSHGGLLSNGYMYFITMTESYDTTPTLVHHICMIDLFSRSGLLEKAVSIIEEMPFSANLTMWHSVLGACRKWGDAQFGKLAFDHTMQLDGMDVGAYVSMGNIYLDADNL